MGTNKNIVVNNKIYKCTAEASYKLISNIQLNDENYIEQYSNCFSEQSYQNESGTTITATRWNGIAVAISFDYNGKTITETDISDNVITHNGEM